MFSLSNSSNFTYNPVLLVFPAPLGSSDKKSLVNLGLAYVDNHPDMNENNFRCNSEKGKS